MKVLITGITGFLGSHLFIKLLEISEYEVIGIKRSTSVTDRIKNHINKAKVYNSDKVNFKSIFKENKVDLVIHTACCYGRNEESDVEILNTNVMYGLDILENSIKCGVKTFINTGTTLPSDLNIYSKSKNIFLDLLNYYSDKIQVVNISLEQMYGPKDDNKKLIAWVISELRKNANEIPLTKGNQLRDLIFIDDVVSGYLLVISNLNFLKSFERIDICSGQLVTIKEVLTQLKQIYCLKDKTNKTKLKFGAIQHRKNELMKSNSNNERIRQLGWEPKVSIKEGLEKTINYTLL